MRSKRRPEVPTRAAAGLGINTSSKDAGSDNNAGTCRVGGSWAGEQESGAVAAAGQYATAPSGHDFEVVWDLLLEPDDEGAEWEASLSPRERQLLARADPGLLASRAATAMAHFPTVPRAMRRLLRQLPGTLLAGGTFRAAVQLPLMVIAEALGCSLLAAVVMCAEEPRLMQVPVAQLQAARAALKTAMQARRRGTKGLVAAAAATALLRLRPSLALLPAEVLLGRAQALALLPDWRVLAELGGGELNRWLNQDPATTNANCCSSTYHRNSSNTGAGALPGMLSGAGSSAGGAGTGVSFSNVVSAAALNPDPDAESAGASVFAKGCDEAPSLQAALAVLEVPRLAAAMSAPIDVMLRLLWLLRKRGSCEYAATVLRLRCRYNDAKAALDCAETWPRDASAGALAAADLEPSIADKVAWLLKTRKAWDQDAVGFVAWLERMDVIATAGDVDMESASGSGSTAAHSGTGSDGAQGARFAARRRSSAGGGSGSRSFWRMALEGL
ncbi:hypothetical protein HYH02_000675 [Chlamydomonas schloesseri]|uniref:Uncharacterized protein n=1 Tax=Chlamydomonas schloesseri TaxID=2026947 RepID=A0A835WV30_9CHLO|nr:hypothetical protein HYH02_000675 [Chlamydomonas schloesseri]|eukprot:KAG2454843.1 hypothetical protein HYH02_000675 [Chlamydomonas schloesseri]